VFLFFILLLVMKKLNFKAFTLVEMLIVIVIIGILIAALLPRLQGAQGRARDVARKNSVNQIGTAIATYLTDHGKLPT
jgi:general secretion pathway protein G